MPVAIEIFIFNLIAGKHKINCGAVVDLAFRPYTSTVAVYNPQAYDVAHARVFKFFFIVQVLKDTELSNIVQDLFLSFKRKYPDIVIFNCNRGRVCIRENGEGWYFNKYKILFRIFLPGIRLQHIFSASGMAGIFDRRNR
jgi:hypothetical protein